MTQPTPIQFVLLLAVLAGVALLSLTAALSSSSSSGFSLWISGTLAVVLFGLGVTLLIVLIRHRRPPAGVIPPPSS